MGAHEGVATIPVDLAVHRLADGGEGVVAFVLSPVVEGVPDVVALLSDLDHPTTRQGARVVGLAAPGRVAGRPIERDPPRVEVDGGHHGVEAAQLGVPQVEELGRRHRPSLPARASTGTTSPPTTLLQPVRERFDVDSLTGIVDDVLSS